MPMPRHLTASGESSMRGSRSIRSGTLHFCNARFRISTGSHVPRQNQKGRSYRETFLEPFTRPDMKSVDHNQRITKSEVISTVVPGARMTLSWIQACRDFDFFGLSSASLPSGCESTFSPLQHLRCLLRWSRREQRCHRCRAVGMWGDGAGCGVMKSGMARSSHDNHEIRSMPRIFQSEQAPQSQSPIVVREADSNQSD